MASAQCLVTAGINWEGVEPLGRSRLYSGTGVFVTTGASVVVYIPDVAYIEDVHATPLAVNATATVAGTTSAAAANGQLTIGGIYRDANGCLRPVTAGQVTVYRIAGTDSALPFSFNMKYKG